MVDIALLGATGFTGSLTADYLGGHLPTTATWAIAGRNAAKLKSIADRIEGNGGVRPRSSRPTYAMRPRWRRSLRRLAC